MSVESKNKVCLMILDGWGIGRKDSSDAIFNAKTPFMDGLANEAPSSRLKTFGEFVGLPDGQMGNSEVGHMNIGAGRVVYQDLVRINKAISDGSFFQEKVLIDALDYATKSGVKVHLMGLVSNGGVHSSQEHLHALLDLCKQRNLKQVFVHAFTDGRDCDPHSGLEFINQLEKHMSASCGEIASVIGRYYAMDRDKRWERVKEAYDLLVNAQGDSFSSAKQAVKHAYDNGLSDEFIKAAVIADSNGKPKATIEAKDVVICFNFRTDRCREITTVLTQQDFPDFGMKTIPLRYLTMTNYDSSYHDIQVIYEKDNLSMTLGETISKAKKTQVRIAETEKYPHVTFFFSGGREQEFEGETRIMVNSPKVATYDLQPEMSAEEVTQAIVKEINEKQPDFICLNFANPDMVGHTGVYSAIMKACETIDDCAKRVSEACMSQGYDVLITADHGNADFAVNDDGSPNTAHTTNLVPLYLLTSTGMRLKDGILADLAPTVLELMNIEQPSLMTGKSLLVQ